MHRHGQRRVRLGPNGANQLRFGCGRHRVFREQISQLLVMAPPSCSASTMVTALPIIARHVMADAMRSVSTLERVSISSITAANVSR